MTMHDNDMDYAAERHGPTLEEQHEEEERQEEEARYRELYDLLRGMRESQKVTVLNDCVARVAEVPELHAILKKSALRVIASSEHPSTSRPLESDELRRRQKARAFDPFLNPEGDCSIDRKTGNYIGVE